MADIIGTPGNDTLEGTAGDDRIEGLAGDDVLNGRDGNDVLIGGEGVDRSFGGLGDDIYFVDSSRDEANELAGEGRDTIYTTVSYAMQKGTRIEVLSSNNHIGTIGMNLFGNEFAQELWGNYGNNVLIGGGGSDVLVGLAGNDTYYIDDSSAIVAEDAEYFGAGTTTPGGFDRVYTSVDYTLRANVSVEILSTGQHSATTPINLTGNELAQEIWGNSGNNIIISGGGNDSLVGLAGDDTYYVVNAGTRVFENVGGGRDTVYTTVSYTLGEASHVEILSTGQHAGVEAINLTGNGFANELWGNAGQNLLDGKSGNDILVGLGGADTFAFTRPLGSGNVDLIADFEVGVDKIALSAAIFSGLTPGQLPEEAFATGTAATEQDDRIIFDTTTGAVYFDADGVGGVDAVQFATVQFQSGQALTANDFIVI